MIGKSIGAFDTRAVIKTVAGTVGGSGDVVLAGSTLTTVWGFLERAGPDAEPVASGARQTLQRAILTVRASTAVKGVRPKDRVSVNSEEWEIEEILPMPAQRPTHYQLRISRNRLK